MRKELRHKRLEVLRLHVVREVANEAKDVNVCRQINGNPRHLTGRRERSGMRRRPCHWCRARDAVPVAGHSSVAQDAHLEVINGQGKDVCGMDRGQAQASSRGHAHSAGQIAPLGERVKCMVASREHALVLRAVQALHQHLHEARKVRPGREREQEAETRSVRHD